MFCIELCIVLVVVASYIDETEHLFIVVGVCRFDKVCTSVNNLLRSRAPVVASSLVEQVDVLLASIHFAPSHTADVRIHTADAVVVVPSRVLRSYTLNNEDRLLVVFRTQRVVNHEILAWKQFVVGIAYNLIGIFLGKLSILAVRILVSAAHVEVDTREHGLCRSL